MNEKRVALVLGLLLVAVVIIGLVRGIDSGADQQESQLSPGGPVTAPNAPTAGPSSDGTPTEPTGEGSPASTPTNIPSIGSDHHDEDTVPASQHHLITTRATEFWSAFSTRDAKKRDKALSAVAVPYLARKMSVRATDRIPVVKPSRSVVVAGSFSLSVTVTEATDGKWWYSTFIYDPAKSGEQVWRVQEYGSATPTMIVYAQKALANNKKR